MKLLVVNRDISIFEIDTKIRVIGKKTDLGQTEYEVTAE